VQNPAQLQQVHPQIDEILPWELSLNFSDLPLVLSGEMHQQSQSLMLENAVYSTEGAPSAEVTNNSTLSENTTLCSLAFSIVMNNNRKGYNATELDLKLRAGYRRGTGVSQDCRIENKILFSVLAEIS
jgi:hypothetical protein